jgi:uncharacterized protein (TIGR00255 family)
MTGYGRSENNDSNYDVIVEVKSLNSRYLEVLPKIHESLYKYENNIISLVRKACKRGKVYLSINLLENSNNCKKIKINDNRLNEYISEIKLLEKKIGSTTEVPIDYFLKLPDIFESKNSSQFPHNKFILKCIDEALLEFGNHRAKEGKIIEKDILSIVKNINKEIKKIVRLSSDNSKEELIKIKARINDIIPNFDFDDNRLYQEVAIILEKKDINEELSRLKGHMLLLEEYILSNDDIGKKSNFLLQEINREINTIGSKVDSLSIKHIVVNMKNNVEKIREQVQNIL